MSKFIYTLGFAFALMCMTTCVFAVDGVVLINQATVVASGGFPYQITQPGSYRLSSDLVVSGSTNAINITTSNVTLDLNGFTITGPGAYSGVYGISDNGTSPVAIAIRNGSLSGWTFAVNLSTCNYCSVQQLSVHGGGSGIYAGTGALISGNILTGGNGGTAISTGPDALITADTVSGFATGIQAGANSTVSGNASAGNSYGIYVVANSTVSGNTTANNLVYGIEATCPLNLVGNTALANTMANIYQNGSGCTLFNNNAP